jgi:hypothetical protein
MNDLNTGLSRNSHSQYHAQNTAQRQRYNGSNGYHGKYPSHQPYYQQPNFDMTNQIVALKEEISFLNKMIINIMTDGTINIKKIASIEADNQIQQGKIKKLEEEVEKLKNKEKETKKKDKDDDDDDNRGSGIKQMFGKIGTEYGKMPHRYQKISKNKIEPKDECCDGIMKDTHKKMSRNDEALIGIINMPINDNMKNSFSMDPISKLLSNIFKTKDDKKNKVEKNDIEEIEEEYIDIDPNIKIEDLGVEIKDIGDIIKLGGLYMKLKDEGIKTPDESVNKKKAVYILSELGMNVKDIDSILEKKEIKLQTMEKKNNGLYELNGKSYSINLEILHKLVKPLEKLQNMIGMIKIKESILDMILYYLQSFERKNSSMLHTVIEGAPGVGKTEVGKIIAEIYAALGIIKNNTFKIVRRTDLIGEYVGHTAHKTQRAIDEADGGVLFIDEAYSLGSPEGRDSFAKECIDTLNQNLSENKRKFICIIAGYPDELEKSFFAQNPGLARRFPFRYKIEGYNEIEMKDIFMKKVVDCKWKLSDAMKESSITNFLTRNKDELNNKGDISIPFMKLINKEEEIVKFFSKNKEEIENYIGPIEALLMKLSDNNETIMSFYKMNKERISNYDGKSDKFTKLFEMSDQKEFFAKHKEAIIKYTGNIKVLLNTLSNNNDDIMKFYNKHRKSITNYNYEIDKLLIDMKNKTVIMEFYNKNIKMFTNNTESIDVLILKIGEIIRQETIMNFFRKNNGEFKNYGGDIDTLLMKAKFVHSRRMFGKHPKDRKIFDKTDIEKGFEQFIQHKKKKEVNDHYSMMWV